MKAHRIASCIAFFLATGGCGDVSGSSTLVLVDGSCSRTNLAAYRDAWQKVAIGVRGGDRLVLGRISSDLLEFRPDLDREMAATNALFDNALDRADREKAFSQIVAEGLSKALAVPCSQRTAILDTLDVAARFLAADRRPHRRLVIMSDMLEDSEHAKFENGLQVSAWKSLLKLRREQHAIPNFAGVEVHVVGAAASSAGLPREVQNFWTAYMAEAGASLPVEHYGPVLFAFGSSTR